MTTIHSETRDAWLTVSVDAVRYYGEMNDHGSSGAGIILGVRKLDPGFVYVLAAGGRFKIGRTTNPARRLATARTWIPEVVVVGMKPFWNHHHVEETLHVGFAECWKAGEWFEMLDEGYRDVLVEGFSEFSDTDRDRNSMEFPYWINSSGMNENTLEQSGSGISRRRFLVESALPRRKP